jgi:hypothetical protein
MLVTAAANDAERHSLPVLNQQPPRAESTTLVAAIWLMMRAPRHAGSVVRHGQWRRRLRLLSPRARFT